MQTDSDYYNILKKLKELSNNKNEVKITSSEFAKHLDVSQQTASRLIIELEKRGYIKRIISKNGQSISITDVGLDILYSEYADLSRILAIKNVVTLRGSIQGGMGEGRYYISRKQYIVQFQEKLGMIPYLGTLNLKVVPEDLNEIRKLRGFPGIHIDGFKTEDRTFGDVKAFRAKIDGVDCYVVMPERTVYTEVIEIISQYFLREKLGLNDGDMIQVTVYVDGS
ncbi:MAG: winged helix-turn-helix domain-containing protein/riboflavin kinase [Thermoplasmata archaeon]